MSLRQKLMTLFTILISTLLISSAGQAQEEFGRSSGDMDSLFGNSSWLLSYFNLTTAGMPYVNRGGASWYIYQYFSMKYKFSKDEVFSLRPTFSTQTPGVYDNFGNTRPMKTELGDFHVAYSNYNLAHLPGYWDLSGTFYAYLPTSQSAQDKKWALRLKSWLVLSKAINRDWTFKYNAKPEYFFQTQKSYRNVRTNTAPNGQEFTTVNADNNQLAELDHYVEIRRYLNRIFEPGFSVGLVHEWYHDSKEADRKPLVIDQFKAGPNTWVEVNKELRFLVGFDTKVDLREPRGKKAFDEDTNSYYLMTFWTIN